MANCKYMRSKYNYTPNDYELSFDTRELPSNIDLQNAKELTLQLQSRSPLGKVIHLCLNEKNENIDNIYEIYNTVNIVFDEKKIEVILV